LWEAVESLFRQSFARATVYPLLDYDLCSSLGVRALELLIAWQKAGITFFQLRAKSLSLKEYQQLAGEIQAHTDLALIVNDHYSLATQESKFAGFHVGQDDLPEEERGAALAMACLKGISTHNEIQVCKACQENWDYIAIGPVFPGGHKKDKMAAFLPFETVKICLKHIRTAGKTPVLIGGIGPANFPDFAGDALPAVISTAMDFAALGALIKKVEDLRASGRMET
jgi:thiamine-phosphate pyrophosphorylase